MSSIRLSAVILPSEVCHQSLACIEEQGAVSIRAIPFFFQRATGNPPAARHDVVMNEEILSIEVDTLGRLKSVGFNQFLEICCISEKGELRNATNCNDNNKIELSRYSMIFTVVW